MLQGTGRSVVIGQHILHKRKEDATRQSSVCEHESGHQWRLGQLISWSEELRVSFASLSHAESSTHLALPLEAPDGSSAGALLVPGFAVTCCCSAL
jgi:hypothetical protein